MSLTLTTIILVLINITNGGLPVINIEVTTPKPIYMINISLPVAPISGSIYVKGLCKGTLLPYHIWRGKIEIIDLTNCSRIIITYIGRPNITNNTLGLVINAIGNYTSIILTWSDNIVIIPSLKDIRYIKFIKNNMIKLARGHVYNITYIILLPEKSRNSIINLNERKSRGVNSRESIGIYIIPIIFIATLIIIVAALSLKRYRKSRKVEKYSMYELSDLEREIIKIIKDRGGSILQSELYRLLGVPRTTLWRAVRRLEERGIVRVEKVNRLNKIVLVEDLERRSHNLS